jgi:hypothetical protein
VKGSVTLTLEMRLRPFEKLQNMSSKAVFILYGERWLSEERTAAKGNSTIAPRQRREVRETL